MIEIRPMRWWHIEQAMPLESELFGSTAWSPAQMWSELARDQRRYYVLVSDGNQAAGEPESNADGVVVGYAGIHLLPPDADVQTVAVAPWLQGQGWARRLVELLIADAASADCSQIMLEVRADNEPALRLYERLGFEVIARRTAYYGPGEDALIMRLRPIPDTSTAGERA
jgi:ribosomal-protein-alanine N-acetyltransferase